MRHNETVLVFPGGGREIGKFKGEKYRLRWDGRGGFARVAIESNYPIVPVALVGGDDVYQSLFARDSTWGRLSQSIGERVSGRDDSRPTAGSESPGPLPAAGLLRVGARKTDPAQTADRSEHQLIDMSCKAVSAHA
jgi:hypothetical protein